MGVAVATGETRVAMETAPPAMLGRAEGHSRPRVPGSHSLWEISGFLFTNPVLLSSFPSECPQCFVGCPVQDFDDPCGSLPTQDIPGFCESLIRSCERVAVMVVGPEKRSVLGICTSGNRGGKNQT